MHFIVRLLQTHPSYNVCWVHEEHFSKIGKFISTRTIELMMLLVKIWYSLYRFLSNTVYVLPSSQNIFGELIFMKLKLLYTAKLASTWKLMDKLNKGNQEAKNNHVVKLKINNEFGATTVQYYSLHITESNILLQIASMLVYVFSIKNTRHCGITERKMITR